MDAAGRVGVVVGGMAEPALVCRASPTSVMVAGLVVCTWIRSDGAGWWPGGGGGRQPGDGAGCGAADDAGAGRDHEAAPPERAGATASLNSTSVELGGSLGIALMGSLGVAVYRNAMGSSALPGVPAESASAARETLASAMSVAQSLPSDAAGVLTGAARGAFGEAFVAVAVVGAALMLIAAGITAAGGTRSRPVVAPVAVSD